jgi:Predicted membrane protein (DUF2142)
MKDVNSRSTSAAITILRYALIPLLAFVALFAWALSSPVGSSPDEDFHLSSVWCGQGIEEGMCEGSAASDERMVPEALPRAPGCYAYRSENSAACQATWFGEESDDLVSTDRGNFTGYYPPAFYFTMNAFVGDDISVSVVAMRLINASLFVGMMSIVYWLLPPGRRLMLAVGVAVTLVPLGVFVIASINPSSWALISGAIVFPAMVGYFETAGRRRAALAGIALLATVMGAGARADSAVYAAIAIVLAAVLSAPRRRSAWRLFLYPLLLGAICLISYLSSSQTDAVSAGLGVGHELIQETPDQIGHNLLNVPDLWAGAFGYWGLGWLDTRMPSMVWVVNLATFGAVVYLGIRRTSARKSLSVLVALLVVWLLPTWVLFQSEALVGTEVQPRYLLPLLILLAQVALFRIEPRSTDMSRSQLTSVAAALTVTNAIALHFDIRRYVTGTDVFAFDLDAGREWWWAVPLSPMALWIVGSAAFGATLFLSARTLAPRDETVATDSWAPHRSERPRARPGGVLRTRTRPFGGPVPSESGGGEIPTDVSGGARAAIPS